MNEFELNEKEAKDYYKEALDKINGVQSEEQNKQKSATAVILFQILKKTE